MTARSTTPTAKAYEALLAVAESLGWPRLWKTDLLEHDRRVLCGADPPPQFCWSVRETGTFLYLGEAGDLWHLLYWELRLMPGSRFFRWDGDWLCELTFAETIAEVERREERRNHGRTAGLCAAGPSGIRLDQLRRQAQTTIQARR